MTRTRIARAAGVAVGVAAILFFGVSAVAAYALDGGATVLPAALGLAALVGTVAVARSQPFGALLVAAAIAVALVRGLMLDAFAPGWAVGLGVGIGLELLASIGLTNRFDGSPAQA
jgi:hypothetical protein